MSWLGWMFSFVREVFTCPLKVATTILSEAYKTLAQTFSQSKKLDSTSASKLNSYESFICYQRSIDSKQGASQWRKESTSSDYDYELILSRTQKIRNFIDKKDIPSLLFVISSGLVRNLGGITNQPLFQLALSGTKDAIKEYVLVMQEAIECVAEDKACNSLLVKRAFFRNSLQIFGQSALILFGGANYGIFHIGVIKALDEQGMLPRVICGISTGAVIGALLCVHKDVSQLTERHNFNFGGVQPKGTLRSVSEKIVRFLRHGMFMDIHVLEQFIRENIGNLTFEEAHKKTGRVLNIIVFSSSGKERPFIMNYIT